VGSKRIGPFQGDHLFDHLPVDGLDVGRVGHLGVGHDGRGIGVHQHHAVAFLAQRLAGLDARIIELARLADDDRAGADDQDGLDVCALGHGSRAPLLRFRVND
jgi:hypothetical protein